MRIVLAAALSLGLCGMHGLSASAQVVEFGGTPRVEELLEVLAPEVPVMRSGLPPTPRKIVADFDPEPSGVAPAKDKEKALSASKTAGGRSPARHSGAISQRDMFAPGSADLLPAGMALLDHMTEVLQRAPNLQILVAGHTDATGNPVANDRLSQQRAEKAVRYLAEKGAQAQRMVAVGRGQRDPLPNLPPTDPANRRLEISRLNDLARE